MMAGVIASGIKWTAEKLSSLLPPAASAVSSSSTLVPTESQSAAAAHENLTKLERTMKRIQAVLMDASKRDVRDHAEKLRLKELEEVAYDAEDVVGEYEYDVLRAKVLARNRIFGLDGSSGQKRKRHGEVIDLDSINVAVPVSKEIAARVKEIRERFEESTKDWETLGWNDAFSSMHQGLIMPTPTMTRLPSSSLVQEAAIHGRNEDKENILKQVLSQDGGNREGNLMVHTIVGMGGIGKTTVAQLVFNDTRVREHFELKGWICVSDDFDVITLTRKIITSFTKRRCDFSELDDLQINLQEEVSGKSFILVLDDVWNENQSLWDSLRLPLTFSRSGTVLVTTRSTAVAKIMQTKPPYILGYLSFGACCSLFKQLVFDYQERDVDSSMMQVAEKIVVKCNGLPLAVKAIGNVCRIEYDLQSWLDILESKEWKPNIQNGDCLPVLKLSYDRMPPPLKRCFPFFGLFPKDYVFHTERIIKLWMSLGLINSSNGKELEDIGRDYIKQLLERSMIQLMEKPEQTFAMHDLLHDLAQLVAGNEVSRKKLEMTSDLSEDQMEKKFDSSEASTIRYLSIVTTQENTDHIEPDSRPLINILQPLQGSRILRLVQVLTWETTSSVRVEIPASMLETWRHIRALDFSNATITVLPESIGNLKLLRYLNVSNTELQLLPNSTFSLYNLQTLEFGHCPLLKLPRGIGQLINLRHLNNDAEYPCYLPYGIGLLTNLQSLKAFVIAKDSSECSIAELKNLAFLKGSLKIFGLNNVSDIEDAKAVNLRKKRYIEQLELNFTCDYEFIIYDHEPEGRRMEFSEELLEILEPHQNIIELKIFNYHGSRFPNWVGDQSFSKLVQVKLAAFHCKLLPPLGQLPSLKYLEIQAAYKVRYIGHEFFGINTTPEGFQSLERSEMDHMPISISPQLVALPSALSSNLTTLVLMDCTKLSTILILPSLSHLGLFGKFHKMLLFNSHLPQLKTIVLSWSHEITNLDLNNQNVRSLEALNIYGCASLESIDGLDRLMSLKRLSITMCPQLYIDPEEHFPPYLDRFEVRGCGDIDYISKDYQPGSGVPDGDLGVRINMMSL